MPVDLPITNSNGILITNMGSEFNKIQELNRNRGLMNPTSGRDPEIDKRNQTTYDYLYDIENQNLILDNNFDSSEELYQTNKQALQYIENLTDGVISKEDETNFIYEDVYLDSEISKKLKEESRKRNDNIFAEQSQDFVKDIQEDISNFHKEENLYGSVSKEDKDLSAQSEISKIQQLGEQLIDLLEKEKDKGGYRFIKPLYKLTKKIYDTKRQEKEQREKDLIADRERFIEKSKPPLSEKLIYKSKSKPKNSYIQKTLKFKDEL
jgi:hypothetical protein